VTCKSGLAPKSAVGGCYNHVVKSHYVYRSVKCCCSMFKVQDLRRELAFSQGKINFILFQKNYELRGTTFAVLSGPASRVLRVRMRHLMG